MWVFVLLLAGVLEYNVLELDASLSCPGRRDETCAHWDHTAQLFVCCDHFGPSCNAELGRWITAFRRLQTHEHVVLLQLLNGDYFLLDGSIKSLPCFQPNSGQIPCCEF